MLWFDIFMAVMMLLIPGCMLLVGRFWRSTPPEDINMTYGYRTRRSMSSQAAWDFSHQVAARAWIRLGLGTLIVTLPLIVVLLIAHLTVSQAGIFGGAVVMIQLILMMLVVPITERALKERFKI